MPLPRPTTSTVLSFSEAAITFPLGHVVRGVGDGRGGRLTTITFVSVERAAVQLGAACDPASRRWVEHLQPGHPRREPALAKLHDVLQRAALHELHRRRGQLQALTGPEFDDVAQQCADDALMNILAKLGEFRGLSRFTTWAYKFVIFEVSGKVARHAWRQHPPSAEDLVWEQLPDRLAPKPGEQAERLEQLAALTRAVTRDLTPRQREVFVAIALNDVPIDVLALQLGSNRNAIYKNLFDARRKLRDSLAAAGHPLTLQEARA
jgi:RNA polymerase sigma-70 factor, ECF subfamily